jgi:hypothetical protein
MSGRVFALSTLTLLIGCAVSAFGEPPSDGRWQLAFSDEFNGPALDTGKWNYRTGPRYWSNQLPANVKVKDGMLRLALREEKSGGLEYTAGGVISKQSFGYGYYEARVKMPAGRGWHTSFWMMPTSARDRFQEIDVCEQDSVDPHSYSVNFHIYKPHGSFGSKRVAAGDLSADFHVYGAEFSPREARFYLDGALVQTVDISSVPKGEQQIWLTSIAANLHKTDAVDEAKLPEYALFDWVRYYRRLDTPAQPPLPALNFAEMIQAAPATAKLDDPGYDIWCGALVRGDDRKYHLYYSRWPRKLGHVAWVTHSEIAHAVGNSPSGPFHFADVALPARGKEFWDGLCTHNPTIVRAGDKYYLYYMGNTGDGQATAKLNMIHRDNQRIGVAVADNPGGPWRRFDRPLIDVSASAEAPDALMTSNPTVARRPDGGFLMIYKAVGKKRPLPGGGPVVHLTATSDSPTGPFTKQLRPIFTTPGVDFPAEDPFAWYDFARERYFAIVKDNRGYFTHAGYSLALWESPNGFDWKLSAHPLVTTPQVTWTDGRTEKLQAMERPQLLFDDSGKPITLTVAIAENAERDGTTNLRIPLKP